jgi:hypothetical protein
MMMSHRFGWVDMERFIGAPRELVDLARRLALV